MVAAVVRTAVVVAVLRTAVVVVAVLRAAVDEQAAAADSNRGEAVAVAVHRQTRVVDISRLPIAHPRSASQTLADSREFQVLLKPRSAPERVPSWGRVRHEFSRVAGTSAMFKRARRFEPMADSPLVLANPERTLIAVLVASSERERN